MKAREQAGPPSVRPLTAWRWQAGSKQAERIERLTPEETAIGICYDSEPYAVLMATPADLQDLALGFTVTEKIAQAQDVLDIRVGEHERGFVVDILLSPEGRQRASNKRRRNMEGRSSCGLCGMQSLDDAVREIDALRHGPSVTHEAVQAALSALEASQDLGRATRASHAAAWADASGGLLAVREDVGRHNALDKLIGAASRQGLDPGEAFVVVTSRCSYEMVEKTAIAGVAVLVAISAPTALAIRQAKAANMTLIALARRDGHVVFAGESRILDPRRPGAAA
jgi:FdhD protein